MSRSEKNQEIVKHRAKAPGRGKKFPVEIVEAAGGSAKRLGIRLLFNDFADMAICSDSD